MVTHVAWKGPKQADGIRGSKILIVGYSHYCRDDEMHDENLTVKVVEKVISGEEQKAFWVSISNYFEIADHKDFWSRVGFMNYVPGPIGSEDEKFRAATEAELEGAGDRLLQAMTDQQSDIAFVFTGKGSGHAKTTLAKYRPSISRLNVQEFGEIRPDYIFDDVLVSADGREHRIILAGHPQGAHRNTMTAMVKTALPGQDRNASRGASGRPVPSAGARPAFADTGAAGPSAY